MRRFRWGPAGLLYLLACAGWPAAAGATPTDLVFARQPIGIQALRGGQPDASSLQFFSDKRPNPTFGFSGDRWWARTTVPAGGEPLQFLRWDAPTADKLAAFMRCGGSAWRTLPRMQARYALFYLGPSSAGCEILLMQESRATIHFSMDFLSAPAASAGDDSTLVGLTLGISLAVSGLSLVLWAATRRRELPWFVMYQMASCVVILEAWGFVPAVIQVHNAAVADFAGAAGLSLWALGYLNYVRHVLRFGSFRPRLNRAMDLLAASMAISLVAHPFQVKWVGPLILLNLITANLCYWVVVLSQWRTQPRRSLQQLIGFVPSLACYLEFLLYVGGRAPLADLRTFFLQGQIATTLVLGFWIARDFKQDRDQREARLAETVRQLEENGAELERYQGDLEALVAGRTAELQRALTNERAIVAQQRDFTAMIGHEFRTPLAVIDGQANRISHAQPGQADLPRRSREIREAVRDMIGLMDGLLFHARHESGSTEYRFEALDLRETLNRAIELSLSSDRRQDLRIDCPVDVTCRADRTLLATAIGNILANAARYSQAGTSITVRANTVGSMLELSIGDRGAGIAPGELETVFARFQRGTNVLTTPGSGLGLFVARQIVEGHGGTITVASMLGQGSCFTVCLPIEAHAGTVAMPQSQS